jgi:uncharacterized protein YhdP
MLQSVAQALRGQTTWRLQLNIAQGQPDITVTSDLAGLHSDWPAPLDKPAPLALPMRWQTTGWSAPLPEAPLRDQLRFDLGTRVHVVLDRELDPQSVDGATRMLAGAVGLNEPAGAIVPGALSVRGQLARLDADAWSRVADRLGGAGDALPAWPRLLASLRVQELQLAARRITQAEVELQQETVASGGPWQLRMKADQLAGRLTWRPPRDLADAGSVTARLARLDLPPQDVARVEPLADLRPTRLPALDVVIDEFAVRGRRLGRLGIEASSRNGATGRDWAIRRLELQLPGATLGATGEWSEPARPAAAGRMALQFALDLSDSGRLASSFGWEDAVRGGSGQVKGQLAWRGSSALAPDWTSLDGRIAIDLSQGQFLRAEPGGVGRLLGILSLQALPRRLLLDFRDVVQQGFAFDQVTGDVRITRGQAQTDNLLMRGLQATVFIEGSANLQRETQDLRVLIVPEVNVGAASLAYLAVNPAVGLGTFVAQWLLRDPLRAANTREFLVSGPMADPKVERVERVQTSLPPEAAAPASAPSLPPVTTETPVPASQERPG